MGGKRTEGGISRVGFVSGRGVIRRRSRGRGRGDRKLHSIGVRGRGGISRTRFWRGRKYTRRSRAGWMNYGGHEEGDRSRKARGDPPERAPGTGFGSGSRSVGWATQVLFLPSGDPAAASFRQCGRRAVDGGCKGCDCSIALEPSTSWKVVGLTGSWSDAGDTSCWRRIYDSEARASTRDS